MANILDPMDLKQIITLHLDGTSNRRIGSILGISRNTVNTYMQLFTASDYTLKELLQFDTPALSELFTSHTTVDTSRHNELMLYFEGINKARTHPGFTFLYHYQQYFLQVQDPYSYTQFLEHYRRKYPREKGFRETRSYCRTRDVHRFCRKETSYGKQGHRRGGSCRNLRSYPAL